MGNRTFGHIGNTFSSLCHRVIAFDGSLVHVFQIDLADSLMAKVYGVDPVLLGGSEGHVFADQRLPRENSVIFEAASHVLAHLSDLIAGRIFILRL